MIGARFVSLFGWNVDNFFCLHFAPDVSASEILPKR